MKLRYILIDTDTYKYSKELTLTNTEYKKLKAFCYDNHYAIEHWFDPEMDDSEEAEILARAYYWYDNVRGK